MIVVTPVSGVIAPQITGKTGTELIRCAVQTHDRFTRYAEFLQLSQALRLAHASAPVHWIVVEDSTETDPAIADLLKSSRIPHTYLAHASSTIPGATHRGVSQRNAAMDVIRDRKLSGPVYFSDDDNLIRAELVKILSRLPKDAYTIFPIGNQGFFGIEGPLVEPVRANIGGVTGNQVRITHWSCDLCRRRWNVDMAGLAFHSSLILANDDIRFSSASETGYLETDLLEILERQNASLVMFRRLLDKVYAWHDHAVPFDRAGFYDADWVTDAIYREKPTSGHIVRGIDEAKYDLPVARLLP